MKKVKTVVTGVGQQIKTLILQGKLTNTQILEKVRADNPLRKTTYACVAWYQSDLKKKASKIDTSASDAWAIAEGLEEVPSALDEIVAE